MGWVPMRLRLWSRRRFGDRVIDRIIRPMQAWIAGHTSTYRGILFIGLMIDANGDPHVVEFNVRCGDPETQVTFPLIQPMCMRCSSAWRMGASVIIASRSMRPRASSPSCSQARVSWISANRSADHRHR